MKRRLLASLLTLVMMLNLLPTVAWARNDEGIDADSVEMYSSDDVVTSGPITLWTGKEGQITVPEENEVRSSNADIVSVEQDGTAVTLTGGSKEGRAEVTAGESAWVVYNYASEAEYNYLYSLFHGKTISVMGDSISTIKDKIPGGNALYYDNTTGKEMTFERNYWGAIITRFGAVEGIDEAWSGSTIGSKAASMASKDRINKLDDMTYIFLYEPSIYMGTYDVTNNKTDYINFGGPAYQKEPTSNEYSVVKLENNYDKATETSLVTLSVDGEQVFAKLNTQGRYGSHGSSLTASDYEQYALEKLNFTFNYLGGCNLNTGAGVGKENWLLRNTFEYIKVTLGDDHTHTYGTIYSSDSTGHWKTCTECGANGEFSKHTGGTATCTAKAVCETCDQPYGELGAHKLTKTDAKAATCTEAGNEAYWTCSGCGKYFSDENGINEIEKDSWVLKTLGHDMTKTDAKEATCTEDGNNEYYTCSRCGGVFKDEAGTQATTVVTETLKKLGHDWSNKNGICARCDAKCTETHKPGTTCSVCHKYTSYPYVPGAPTYPASAPAVPNGTVTVSPANASKGANVTVTVKPNEGYELGSLAVKDASGDLLPLADLGSGKYSFVMPDGKVSVEAEFVKTAATSFTDVPASAYYAKAVEWAVENGITNGMTETTFAPNATCTRGQSVTFLYRALKGTASGSTNFTDVKSDAFYADAINWAVANNVTNGTSNTTFGPNADCTRAEIVTFLYRAYQGK